MIKGKSCIDWAVIFISILIIFELFYAPSVNALKLSGKFMSLRLFGYHLTFVEIVIYIFITFGLLFLMLRISKTKKILIGPKRYHFLAFIFGLSIIINLVLGIINLNEKILMHFSTMAYPLFLFLIFMNVKFKDTTEKIVYNILFVGSIIIMITNFLIFFVPEIVSKIFPSFGIVGIDNFMIINFLFCISFARIILEKFSMPWLILCILSFLTIILHLSKVAVFALFISFILLSILSFEGKHSKYIFRFIGVVVIILFVIFIFYNILPDQVINEMVSYIKYQYLNIGRGMAENDLSTGRFQIWTNYLVQSMYSFGVSPKGFGASSRMEVDDTLLINKGAHNILVYYAYHGGYIAAISLLLLIIIYIYSGLKTFIFNYKKETFLPFQRYEIVGCFFYTIIYLAINMIGLRIVILRMAWIFWFFVAIILKRCNKISLSSISNVGHT